MWRKLLNLFSRKHRVAHRVGEFMHANKDLLVIVCDPKTDTIMTGYRDFATAGAIKPDELNKKTRAKVVSSVLSMSRIDKSVDRFLLQIDGAVFNLAKALRDKRAGKEIASSVGPAIRVKPPSVPVATA